MQPIHFARTLAPVIAGLFLASVPLRAQTTEPTSLADAARASREQKKNAPQTGKIITNDSLGPSTAASSSSSTPAAEPAPNASAESSASTTDAKSTTPRQQPELSPADQEKLKAEVASLKQQLKDEQSDVELQKRLVELDKDAYFSQTDFTHDTQGKAKLDSEQDDLKQKEEAFEKLKAKLLSIAPQEALPPASAEQPKP